MCCRVSDVDTVCCSVFQVDEVCVKTCDAVAVDMGVVVCAGVGEGGCRGGMGVGWVWVVCKVSKVSMQGVGMQGVKRLHARCQTLVCKVSNVAFGRMCAGGDL